MPYDARLAQKVAALLLDVPAVDERKMFGGVAFLIHGNMSVGVHGDNLIVRVGPERHAEAMAKPHTRPFDISGRPMAGWLMVEPEGLHENADLVQWVELGIHYAQSLPPK